MKHLNFQQRNVKRQKKFNPNQKKLKSRKNIGSQSFLTEKLFTKIQKTNQNLKGTKQNIIKKNLKRLKIANMKQTLQAQSRSNNSKMIIGYFKNNSKNWKSKINKLKQVVRMRTKN